MVDLNYLKMSKPQKFVYNLAGFFKALPKRIGGGLKGLALAVAGFFKGLGLSVADLFTTFKNGDWKTRLSYLVMGSGSMARGQWGRGLLFFLFQTVFNLYMVNFGMAYLAKLNTLGTIETHKEGRVTVYGDNSFLILLYGVLTLFFILAFIYTWRVNIKQNKISQQILASGRKLKSTKDDLQSLVDSQFHKTLLALPTLGVFVFTILPIFFMILVAFTNFDYNHQPPSKLFTWVGFENFKTLLSSGTASYGDTFRQVLFWTLVWAFFATFLNYFLGMFVAIMINKKGIKLKKVWRTILVMTIAIPQFVSLLYVSKMFAADGLINTYLMKWHWISQPIPFWTNPGWARFTIILINIWIGIPYLMLIATGILMNIPADLYESARIDGANAERRADVRQDHAALHAVRHRAVPSDLLHREHQQLQRHLPAVPGQADGPGGQRRLYRPADHLAVPHDRVRHQLQDRRRHRHHGVRGAGRDQPGGLQPDTVRQE